MLTIVQGDNKTLTVTQKSTTGAAYNLTGCTLSIIVKRSYDDADASALITGSFTISTPANGIGVFEITPAMTQYMSGLYTIDIRLTITATSAVYTTYRDELWRGDR
jgi:hypothetical protein